MSIRSISAIGFSAVPDNTGNVYAVPYTVKVTGSPWSYMVVVYADNSVKLKLHGSFVVPADYVTSPRVYPVWNTPSVTGAVVWSFDYSVVPSGSSLGATGVQETLNATSTAPTAQFAWGVGSVPPASANFASGRLVQFTFSRDCSQAGDTMAADALVHDVVFEYSDA